MQDKTLLNLMPSCEAHYIPLKSHPPPPTTYTYFYVIHPSLRLPIPRSSTHLWLPICYFASTISILLIGCPVYLTKYMIHYRARTKLEIHLDLGTNSSQFPFLVTEVGRQLKENLLVPDNLTTLFFEPALPLSVT